MAVLYSIKCIDSYNKILFKLCSVRVWRDSCFIHFVAICFFALSHCNIAKAMPFIMYTHIFIFILKKYIIGKQLYTLLAILIDFFHVFVNEDFW